eukprot:4820343-Prorocentrum_lima.AAC.1
MLIQTQANSLNSQVVGTSVHLLFASERVRIVWALSRRLSVPRPNDHTHTYSPTNQSMRTFFTHPHLLTHGDPITPHSSLT